MVQALTVSAEQVSVPFAEVCRYLMLGKASPDAALTALISNSVQEFQRVAHYTACFMKVPVKITDTRVDFNGLSAESKHLARHLQGCTQSILFAATTGLETERQRKRAGMLSPAKALVLDAVGTAAIERFCDILCERWKRECSPAQIRTRFSPGYGDLALEFQVPLLRTLEAARHAGITLTESLLMIPQKSVSAIVGIGPAAERPSHGCADCGRENCDFARES